MACACGGGAARKRGKLRLKPSRQLQPFCVGFRQETMNGQTYRHGTARRERDPGYAAVPLDQEQIFAGKGFETRLLGPWEPGQSAEVCLAAIAGQGGKPSLRPVSGLGNPGRTSRRSLEMTSVR